MRWPVHVCGRSYLKGQFFQKKDYQLLPVFKFCTFDGMIYITQLIYIIPGQEAVFNQFEDIAIPIISKYNGRLLLRVKPATEAFIELHVEKPYEIHLVAFDTEMDFENFMRDDERKKFLHLKQQSIRESVLIKGLKLG